MGVTELFHFRRLMRKGRRVADGNRPFVIGLDKSSSDANYSSSPSTTEGVGIFPKGSHFIVAFNSSVQLSEQEMDACNNNNIEQNNRPQRCDSDNSNRNRQASAAAQFGTCSNNGDVVVFTMMPGASSTNPRGINMSNSTSEAAAAVITTTELEEVRLFAST